MDNINSAFVEIANAVPDVILEIRYYSTFNFIGDRIDGYIEPTALLTKEAATALKAAADELIRRGYRLKIYDAYRPQKAVDHFVRWAKDTDDRRMKKIFYPDVPKEKLFELGFIAEHSGQPYAKVAADGERNFWMTAQEALEYGMVDQILTKK